METETQHTSGKKWRLKELQQPSGPVLLWSWSGLNQNQNQSRGGFWSCIQASCCRRRRYTAVSQRVQEGGNRLVVGREVCVPLCVCALEEKK